VLLPYHLLLENRFTGKRENTVTAVFSTLRKLLKEECLKLSLDLAYTLFKWLKRSGVVCASVVYPPVVRGAKLCSPPSRCQYF